MSTDRTDSSRPAWEPIVVAHRGFWWLDLPENSRAAFARARDFDFPAECDVQQTLEGEPIVIHDELLDRTTTGRGQISACSAESLRQLRLKHPRGLTEPPPMLRDVSNLVALVEIKPPDARSVVQRVIDIMRGQRWLLQSFDPRNIEHALEVDASTSIALLVDSMNGFEPAISSRWTVHADHQLLDDRTVGTLHDHGLRVGAWTVNTEEEITRILPLRPDVIISDIPIIVRQILVTSGVRVGEFK
ncbi:MAG TPA: glycerophosphodiester phosphodiesterase family protein [Tepidisphaeraceae bacterium]|nr:glycerophosphodiester phosphodiesterase family protein [Tepidisphaeraceae bacterium]